MKKIFLIFGTRPEVVKMAPLLHEMKKSGRFDPIVCTTGQHREMANEIMGFFQIRPDIDLDVMAPDQTLAGLTSAMLDKITRALDRYRPDLVIVQGDTASTLAGALAAFYSRIKIAHLEAGLRSFDKFSPFPEEVNRILTSHLVDYHFAPTRISVENLIREGISGQKIHLVGNTVIDALFACLEKIRDHAPEEIYPRLKDIDYSGKMILVTGHRRESFGGPFVEICQAIEEIAHEPGVEIVYPVHMNPNVKDVVYRRLSGRRNIHLLDPVPYPAMVYLMSRCSFVLTDSGGIQEEAPSLKKPVLIMREVTERTEGIERGVARLVGTSRERIVNESLRLLRDREAYASMATGDNPYGDGTSAKQIVKIMESTLAE